MTSLRPALDLLDAAIVRIELLYQLDPQRDMAMLDAAWVVALGWIVGVVWCAPFLAARYGYRWRRRRRAGRATAQAHRHSGPPSPSFPAS